MAIGEGFYGTSNNGIGQGLAYVLPDTKSEDYMMQIAQQESRGIEHQKALSARAAQTAKLADNKRLLDFNPKDYWDIDAKKIGDKLQAFREYGANYSVENNGKSPFSDTKFLKDQQDILDMAAVSGSDKQYFDAIEKQYRAAPEKFKKESFDNVRKFYMDNTLEGRRTEGLKRPSLERQYDMTDFVTGLNPATETYINDKGDTLITDEASTKNLIQSASRLQTPEGKDLMLQNGAQKKGNGVYFSEPGENGIPVFSTDRNFTWKTAGEILANDATKDIAKTWGVNVDGKAAQVELSLFIEQQNEAADKTAKAGQTVLDSAVDTSKRPDNSNFMQKMQLERLAIAKRNAARLEAGGAGATGANQPVSVTFPIGEDGKGIAATDDLYPVSITNANFTGTKTYDLTTGKLGEDLPASADYGVVGVANFPMIKKDAKLKLSGSLAQPDFARNNPDKVEQKAFTVVQATDKYGKTTHFVPYELTPNNVKNTKAFQAAIKGFTPGQQSVQSKAEQSPAKTTPTGLPKKGDTRAVQGGTAIFDGSNWVMEK